MPQFINSENNYISLRVQNESIGNKIAYKLVYGNSAKRMIKVTKMGVFLKDMTHVEN